MPVTSRQLVRSNNTAAIDPVLEVIGRRKWLALVVFTAVFGSIVTVALSLPDLYRATATVLVEQQRVSEVFVTPTVTSEIETRIQMIQQQVMSRARLNELIARFNLYPELRQTAPLEALINRMRRDVRGPELKGIEQPISGRHATVAFAISYSGRDPQTVATVANALAALYVDENSNIRKGQAAQTADFLKGQLEDAKAELDQQEHRASAYKLSHIGELPQQVEANLASLERLNTQLRLNGENQIRAMDRRERFEKQLADAQNSAPVPKAGPVPRAEQLAKLRQELSDARSHFTEAYPTVIRLQSEVAALEQEIAEGSAGVLAGPAAPDPAPRLRQSIADVDGELRALKDEEVALRQAIIGYEQRIDSVPRREEEYQTISRDFGTTKERYDTLLKRFEEAQLAESLEQGKQMERFRILDAAIPPRDPAAPHRLRILLMALVAAIGLTIGTVVVAEKINTAFHDIDDLRSFVGPLTVIRVPLIPTSFETRRRRVRLALATAIAVASLMLIVAGSRYVASGNEQIVRLIERGNV